MSDITDMIIEGIQEIAEIPPGVILSKDTDFERDLGFDSGNFIELFLFLEDRISGFTLGAARLTPEDFYSVDHLAKFIGKRLEIPEAVA